MSADPAPAPAPSLYGRSFYIATDLSEEGLQSYMGASNDQEQASNNKIGLDLPVSSHNTEEEGFANQELSQAPRRTSQTSQSHQKTPITSPESPHKNKCLKIPAGPKAPIPRRRSSVPLRRKGHDLISFHRQSCRLFQSLEGTLASSQGWTPQPTEPHPRQISAPNTFRPVSQCIIKTDNGFAYLASTPQTPRFGQSPQTSRRNSSSTTPLNLVYDGATFPSTATTATTTTTNTSSFSSLAGTSGISINQKGFSTSPPPHPVSIWSWTSAESRRLEYKKIDRSHSGVRSLWKKTMPRWCGGKYTRHGFWDGKSNDGASVRRYRVEDDVSDGERSKQEQDTEEDCGLHAGEGVNEKKKGIRETKRERNEKGEGAWKWRWTRSCSWFSKRSNL